MTKKKARTHKRERGKKRPTENAALRRVAMFDALWDALQRGRDDEDQG
ncbi:hypothetical protein [Streptomyces erythrochromogenes]